MIGADDLVLASPPVPALTAKGTALLGNPFWHALGTEHASLAQGSYLARRYPADVIPFAAVASHEEAAFVELRELLVPGESIYITGDLPPALGGLLHELTLPGLQMVYAPERADAHLASATSKPDNGGRDWTQASVPAHHPESEQDRDSMRVPAAAHVPDAPAHAHTVTSPASPPIERLGPADLAAILELKRAAFPGYFGPRAPSLGVFYGIRVAGELVSMAGERLALPGLREVSAVCTHPAHTGRGYSARLVEQVVRHQLHAGILPFLQVARDNTRAIALYQRLGFVPHGEILFHRLSRTI